MQSHNTVTASMRASSRGSPPVVPVGGTNPASRVGFIHGVIVLALLGFCFALYARTFGLGFLTLDDPDYIQNNPWIDGLNAARLWHILSSPYFANYSPGHLLSYALDVAVAGGKNAWAMHVSNVLWYGWVVCMVYVLGLALFPDQARTNASVRLFGARQHTRSASSKGGVQAHAMVQDYTRLVMAAAAALLFAAHPAHVEVVAWLSSRKDLVATGFAALSMACYVWSRRGSRGLNWWYGASLASFLLASSGKQSVLLLPLIMLVWDVVLDNHRDWKMVLDKIPFGLVALFFGWMTWGAQPSTRQSPDAFILAMTQWSNLWLLTGLGEYVLYRPRPDPATVNAFLKAAIIIAAVLVWTAPIVLSRFRRPLRALLCCWALIQMLPPMALSFLTPITDRYLFLPSVGLCLLLAVLLLPADFRPDADTQKTRQGIIVGGWILLALVLSAWTWKTWSYLSEWRDPRSLWYFAARKSPSPQAFEYSGEVYHEAADRVGAFIRSGNFSNLTNDLKLASVVLEDSPQFHNLRAEWLGAGVRTNSLAYRDRLWSMAWQQYQQAVAHRGTLNNPTLFMRRGMILLNRGQYQDAIQEFKTGLDLAQLHTYQKVRDELGTGLQRAVGVAYWGMGKYADAKEWLLRAQSTQRQSGQTWVPTLDQEVERVTLLAKQQQ